MDPYAPGKGEEMAIDGRSDLDEGSFKGYRFQRRCPVVLAVLLTLIPILLFGCGGGSDGSSPSPSTVKSQILSDPAADGDIAFTPPATYVVSSSLTTLDVLAGVDPDSGDEYRGFLDFPLGGSDGVPINATIVSATLEIVIDSVTVAAPDDTVPMILDLVSFQPPTLISTDFDRSIQPPLLSQRFTFFTTDAGTSVAIDVTSLMEEAQHRGLPDFQVRLLLDFSAASGLIQIDDDAAAAAPLLTVRYF
jgi:hypothetical protein